MSISTSAYQHISFKSFLVESDGLTIKSIVDKWKQVVPYRQKYINKTKIDEIAELIADPALNMLMIKAIRAALAIGKKPESNLTKVVFLQNLNGSVLNFEDEKIKQLEKMLRRANMGRNIVTELEREHLLKQGIDLNNFVRGSTLGDITALVTTNPSMTGYYQAHLRDDSIIVHIGCTPHIYGENDKDFLSSIIYHEVRHAYDAYFAGIKRGEYDYMQMRLGNNVELKKYYKSLAEARAYTDQIIYLIEKFKKKHNTNVKSAISSIKSYLRNKNEFTQGFPSEAFDLFQSFLDELAKNPKLGGLSEDINPDITVERPAIVRQVEDAEISEKIWELDQKIMETFRFSHNHDTGE
jgi:hypothetical protein